jgi:hypothetical protein
MMSSVAAQFDKHAAFHDTAARLCHGTVDVFAALLVQCAWLGEEVLNTYSTQILKKKKNREQMTICDA